jgi:hypothetical protein
MQLLGKYGTRVPKEAGERDNARESAIFVSARPVEGHPGNGKDT